MVQRCENRMAVSSGYMQDVWALPIYGIQFVLNSVNHIGTGSIMQLDDAVGEFTERLFLILVHMQLHRWHSSTCEWQQADIVLLQ
jgi:hypothetical protein